MFCEGIGESKPNKSLVSGIVSAMENKWVLAQRFFTWGRASAL